ncbi:MAG: hypothetical protein K9J16_18990 [Melioribacteraceae bacterium]|nr:hypothetical protein [Melioribacteraceae bacterium]MCF8354713.1 hypothetical protein [Melioribacteraceae bacterium]MCF8396452.1 hypothetical protein [Melioribacteraceae bacterium]MCF8418071.1 hypothetical protein [Melioribacteraceae bacterium]
MTPEIITNTLQSSLIKLYGDDTHTNRYENIESEFKLRFGSTENLLFFSAPGRTELCGNHTDHNHGKVLAASINLDTIGAAKRNNKNIIRLYSEGYKDKFEIDLSDLEIKSEEKESTTALIRGIAYYFKERGYNIGGFDSVIESNVLVGSGLSSSASVEILIGTIFNCMFNKGEISPVDIAKIGQLAENEYFGKPCGLMDQMASAVGGIISIDFKEPKNPVVEKIEFDFDKSGYNLIVVDTGGNHADLTNDYASIPNEMKSIADHFGVSVLRDIEKDQLMSEVNVLRQKTGDRAILRAIHFLDENVRVDEIKQSLKKNNFNRFLELIDESGNSSAMFLQNCYTILNHTEQGISLALALTKTFIKEHNSGACRVHGGGFAGTIQAFIPDELTEEYVEYMNRFFGNGTVEILSIRNHGSICVNNLS